MAILFLVLLGMPVSGLLAIFAAGAALRNGRPNGSWLLIAGVVLVAPYWVAAVLEGPIGPVILVSAIPSNPFNLLNPLAGIGIVFAVWARFSALSAAATSPEPPATDPPA